MNNAVLSYAPLDAVRTTVTVAGEEPAPDQGRPTSSGADEVGGPLVHDRLADELVVDLRTLLDRAAADPGAVAELADLWSLAAPTLRTDRVEELWPEVLGLLPVGPIDPVPADDAQLGGA